MLNVVYWGICVCFLFQTIKGKSIDFDSSYQEIEDKSNSLIPDVDENEQMEENQLPEGSLGDICKYFRLVNIRNTSPYSKCLEQFLDDTREVTLVKRDVADENEMLEGSGDIDDERVTMSPRKEEEKSKIDDLTEDSLIPAVKVGDKNLPQSKSAPAPPGMEKSILKELDGTNKDADGQKVIISPIKEEEPSEILSTHKNISEESLIPAVIIASQNASQVIITMTITPDTIQSMENSTLQEIDGPASDNPLLFKNGFDEILKNAPGVQHNTSIEEGENPIRTLKSEQKESVALGASNNETINAVGGEISKAGESQEQTSAASPNSILLLVFAGLGIVGTLAFAFNYIKKKREDREANEIIKLEEEGRELKEIKPLIKNPLIQNGAKSLEYIDAEPQKGAETEPRVEMNRNMDNVQ